MSARTHLRLPTILACLLVGVPLNASASSAGSADPQASGSILGHSLLPAITAGDWTGYRNRPPRGGYNQAETALTAATLGKVALVRTLHGKVSGGEAGVTGHGLFVTGAASGSVDAYDQATGVIRWHNSAGGSSQIAIGADAVYTTGMTASDTGELLAYDAATGALRWRRHLPGSTYVAPPAVTGNRVTVSYVATVRRTSFAYVAAYTLNGGLVWNRQLPQSPYSTEVSAPAIASGTIALTVDSGLVYSLNATTGRMRWRVVGSGGYGPSPVVPVIRGSHVIVGLVDGVLRDLDATTGTLLWSRSLGGPIWSTSVVAGGVVYALSSTSLSGPDVYAVDESTGAVRWSRTVGVDFASPTLAGGVLYLARLVGSDALIALDAATGTTLRTWRAPSTVYTEPMVSHGQVYYSTGGNIFVLGLPTGAGS